VIGINTAVAGDSQGIGFAIPINIARPLLAQASAGQELARPWLGIRFQTIDPEIKQAADLPVDNGAWIPTAASLSGDLGPLGGGASGAVDPIVAGSPAALAPAAGDIITAVDGRPRRDPSARSFREPLPWTTVTLDVLATASDEGHCHLGGRDPPARSGIAHLRPVLEAVLMALRTRSARSAVLCRADGQQPPVPIGDYDLRKVRRHRRRAGR
jgi:hypothetical protein